MKEERIQKGYMIRGIRGWLMPWTFRITRKDSIREVERCYGKKWEDLKSDGFKVVKGEFKSYEE